MFVCGFKAKLRDAFKIEGEPPKKHLCLSEKKMNSQLQRAAYFDQIITMADLFDPKYY